MSELLALEHAALSSGGATLTMSVRAGQSVALVGPAGAGKSRLLRVLAGLDRPGQGRVHIHGRTTFAGSDLPSRRARVHALARGMDIQSATDILLLTGLLDARQTPLGELTPGQLAAAELVAPLTSDAEVIFVDGQLDGIDPWTAGRVEERLKAMRAKGRALVFATHRPELAARADAVIVLREGEVRFAGTVPELLRAGPPHSLVVGSQNESGVRALVEPFEVSVRVEGETLRMEAKEGQALAARLLLEGYGEVRFVVVRPPTLDEALRRL